MTTGAADSTTTSYRGDEVSDIVVTSVAQAKGVDPLELEPLYNVVDPDALDSIFAGVSPESSMELSFTMAGCQVVVHGDGEVNVTTPEGDESSITITRLDD